MQNEEEAIDVEDVHRTVKKIKLGKKRIQMTKYNGESKAEVLLGWIHSLDMYFAQGDNIAS